MKEELSPLRFNDLPRWSASARRAERLLIFSYRVIADFECHVCSSWVDSTRINHQPTSRIIHTSSVALNRGAAGDFIVLTRSGDITLELTGREKFREAFNLANDIRAFRSG